jgi:hypothetical protein
MGRLGSWFSRFPPLGMSQLTPLDGDSFHGSTLANQEGAMPRTVLIQEPDVLISLDLAQTVIQSWPDATLVLCRDPGQALARLNADRAPNVVILRQSWRAAHASGLAAPAMRLGARVLLTAADADETALIAAVGWRAIDMPFTTEHVQNALHDLTASNDEVDSRCKAGALG